MGNTIEKLYGGPAIILLVVGILSSFIMFNFMFKYADEGNLFMVILIPLVVSIVALVVGMSLGSMIEE